MAVFRYVKGAVFFLIFLTSVVTVFAVPSEDEPLNIQHPLYVAVRTWVPQHLQPSRRHLHVHEHLNRLFAQTQHPPMPQDFRDLLNATDAGIEIQTKEDLYFFQDVRFLLGRDTTVTLKQFNVAKKLDDLFEGILFGYNKDDLLDLVSATDAGIEIQTRNDFLFYQTVKKALKGKTVTPALFNAYQDGGEEALIEKL